MSNSSALVRDLQQPAGPFRIPKSCWALSFLISGLISHMSDYWGVAADAVCDAKGTVTWSWPLFLKWGGDGDSHSGGKHVKLAVHKCEGYFREPGERFVSSVCKEIGSEGLWSLAPIMSPGPQANPAGHQIQHSHFIHAFLCGYRGEQEWKKRLRR